MSASPSPSPTAPAAWHADPSGRHELRYWDGARWTDHVSDRGVAALDVVARSPTPHAPDPATSTRVAFWVGVAALVVAAGTFAWVRPNAAIDGVNGIAWIVFVGAGIVFLSLRLRDRSRAR